MTQDPSLSTHKAADAPRGTLVTGGARGIGAAIASALARRGDDVVVADLDGDGAEKTAQQLRGEGLSAQAEQLDVADPDAIARVVEKVDREQPLGTVVNNAGIGFSAPIVDVTIAQFRRLMAVNLEGVFFMLQAAARVMQPRGAGCIVNLASTSGFTASTAPMVVYDTSKGAVRMLTVSAARELSSSGIRVNAVAPGTIDTDLTRSLAVDPGALDRLVERRIPLGRLGQPADIAEAVAWLSSAAAGYVTGHVLVVDGGWLT